MRKLRRSSLQLPTLAGSGKGARAAADDATKKQADSSARLSFKGREHWREPDVIGALHSRHGHVCAYCGCGLADKEKGDVEHFRPKGKVTNAPEHGGYWWLAFSFRNYLVSCWHCNQVIKGNHFPLRPRGKRRTASNWSWGNEDVRWLLHPEDDVEQWMVIDWRDPLCEIQPRDGIPVTARQQVVWTRDFFRLNEEPAIGSRVRTKERVDEALKTERFSEVQTAACRYQPHSLFVRQMLSEVRPELIPDEEFELKWMIKQTANKLKRLAIQLSRNGLSKAEKALAKEYLWTLAALWKEPPVGASSDVEALLGEFGLKSRVQPLFDRL
jgi:uncharacterized protein (TIGR02646 family)